MTDPDPKEKLAYAWFVDGRPVGTGKTLRFEAPSLDARKVAQRVEVEVTDAADRAGGAADDRAAGDHREQATADNNPAHGDRLPHASRRP